MTVIFIKNNVNKFLTFREEKLTYNPTILKYLLLDYGLYLSKSVRYAYLCYRAVVILY